MSQTIELESISRLDIKPGEILVVRLPANTTCLNLDLVRTHVESCLPEGAKLLIVSADTDLSVLCPSSPASPADA